MKQRDAAIGSRGADGGGAAESGHAQRVAAEASAAAAAAALATATAAATAAQHRARALEEKVGDLETRIEQALAEKDRWAARQRTETVQRCCLLIVFKVRTRRDNVCRARAGGGSQRGANGGDCEGCAIQAKCCLICSRFCEGASEGR
jgi:hypothetical protein